MGKRQQRREWDPLNVFTGVSNPDGKKIVSQPYKAETNRILSNVPQVGADDPPELFTATKVALEFG